MFIRSGREFEEKLAEAKARDALIREEQERASHISITLNKPLQNLPFTELEKIFKPDAPIIAATKEFLAGKKSAPFTMPEANEIPVLVLDDSARAVQYMNIIERNASLNNSLSPILIPNHEKYRQPKSWERFVSFLNNLFENASSLPAAQQIAKMVKEKTPVIADAATAIAVHKIAPPIANAVYWAKDKSEDPKVRKLTIRLGKIAPLFALMATPMVAPRIETLTAAAALPDLTPRKASEATASLSIDISSVPLVHCGQQSPMVAETPLGTFFETDSAMCKRIKEAVMAPSKHFTQYNEHVGVRALENGNFEYRLVIFKAGSQSFEELLKEHGKTSLFGKGKVRQAYIDTYRFKTNDSIEDATAIFSNTDLYIKAETEKRAGKDFSEKNLQLGNTSQVQNAIKFKQNYQIESYALKPISAENYQAVVGGWLITPLPFSFYLVNADTESGFDAKAKSSAGSATGLYQTTSATFLTMVKKYAKPLGLDDLHAQVMAISGKYKHDRETIKDPEYLAIFNKESKNPFYSAAFSVMNFVHEIKNTQSAVDEGKIVLPEGRTKLIEIDVRLLHFMRHNAKVLWRALAENPNSLVRDVLPSIYKPNANIFKNLTVQQYYDQVKRTSGFGQREINVSPWLEGAHTSPFATNVNKREILSGADIGGKFKIVAQPESVIAIQERPNVSWLHSRFKNIGVEPIITPVNPAQYNPS